VLAAYRPIERFDFSTHTGKGLSNLSFARRRFFLQEAFGPFWTVFKEKKIFWHVFASLYVVSSPSESLIRG
jgi:hypothetical protein